MMFRITFLLIFFATVGSAYAADEKPFYNQHTIRFSDIPNDAPTFDQFLVRETYTDTAAEPDVKSHRLSRLFRTVIKDGAKRGPNFSGHYTLVFWGCGTGCIAVAIVDAKSGKVFHPKNLQVFDNINVAYEELEPPEERLVKFRLNSKLLVVIGGINEDPALRGVSYFLWEKEQLRRIRFVHKPYE